MDEVVRKIPITKGGLESLKSELDELVNEKRPKFVERLSVARIQGDLMENTEYHNAKDELEFLDGRIAELEGVLRYAVVADGNAHGSAISLGTCVTLKVNGTQHIYHIVGESHGLMHTQYIRSILVGDVLSTANFAL